MHALQLLTDVRNIYFLLLANHIKKYRCDYEIDAQIIRVKQQQNLLKYTIDNTQINSNCGGTLQTLVLVMIEAKAPVKTVKKVTPTIIISIT